VIADSMNIGVSNDSQSLTTNQGNQGVESIVLERNSPDIALNRIEFVKDPQTSYLVSASKSDSDGLGQ